MIEEWKEIHGYDGDYQISNLGNIKSFKYKKERLLKTSSDRDGYRLVGLRQYRSGESRRRMCKVHRLVAYAFIEDDSDIGLREVNHIDGDKTNNSSVNLEWCTKSQNMRHATMNGLCDSVKKIDEIQAITVKTFLKSKWKIDKIANSMGISRHIVPDISRGKTWKHV